MNPSLTRSENWKPFFFGGLLIVLATLLAYWPAMRGGFIWDDDAYVTDNPMLIEPNGLWHIWFSAHHQSQYFPLVYTTLRLEHALWGLNAFGYHLVNVLLHCANALLAWTVLHRLKIPGAWLAAAIFALHPVQVETAAWITELKNTESTVFYFLALLAWMKFSAPNVNVRWRFYFVAIALYWSALFAKTTACTFPAAMVLVLWLRGQRLDLRRVAQIVPFLLFGVLMGLVSIWWEAHLGNYLARFNLNLTWPERFLIATRAIWFYLGKLVWPANLTFSYPRWQLNPREASQYLWAVACVIFGVLLWWKRREWRPVVLAAAFFVATLLPMLGFFPLFTFYFSFVADHYQYLACLGPITLFAAGVCWAFKHWNAKSLERSAVYAFVLGALAITTWNQAHAYGNIETLWRDTLKKNPDSWLAHNNLGMVLAKQGNREEAEAHYREAIRLNPANGDAQYNLANLLFTTGRRQEALEHYEKALPFSPESADYHNNYGVALYATHQAEAAIAQFREALRLNPDLPSAHMNLAIAYDAEHKRAEAIQEYREVLRLLPDAAVAQGRLRALTAAGTNEVSP